MEDGRELCTDISIYTMQCSNILNTQGNVKIMITAPILTVVLSRDYLKYFNGINVLDDFL